jgi:alpha-glucosidase
LLPYIYTGMEEMSRKGVPLMRPLYLEYPKADGIAGNDHDFLFGRDLLVAPVTTEKVDSQIVLLPPGDWYDYWTAEKRSSKEPIVLRPELDQMPLYVRAGAIVPTQALVQYTGEIPAGGLKLRVYPGPDCSGSLYEDDGHTFAYQKGDVLRVRYSCEASSGAVTISANVEKSGYKPWWTATEVTVFGAPGLPTSVKVSGSEIRGWSFDEKSHVVTLTVDGEPQDWNAEIAY